MDERRKDNASHRRSRIKAGGVATPLAIVVSYFLHKWWMQDMSTEATIALSSVIGSLTAAGTICFWDIRSFFLAWLKRKRRAVDRA